MLWETELVLYNDDLFNSNDKLVFEIIVDQPSESYTNMQFEWEIEYEDGDTGEIIAENLLNDTIFDFVTQYNNYLVIDVKNDNNSFFEANINYTIIANVSMDSSAYNCNRYAYTQLLCSETSSSNTTISMNEAPSGGYCDISTADGNGVIYALKTLVNVSCSEWSDEQIPLTYRFALHDGMLYV